MDKYRKAVQLLDNHAAAINTYENLPTRVSPSTLTSSYMETDEEKYESGDEYPFETLNTLQDKWSEKEDK